MLFKYVMHYLKNHRKQSIWLMIFMSLLTTAFLGIQISSNSQKKLLEKQSFENFGEWQVHATNWQSDQTPEKALGDAVYLILYQRDQIKNSSYLYAIEGDYEKALAYHLIEGKMPEKENEIAISKAALSRTGYLPILGQTITLDLNSGQTDYTLVGITDYISSKETYNYPDFIICQGNYYSKDLFLGSQINNRLIDTLDCEEIRYQYGRCVFFQGRQVVSASLSNLETTQYTISIMITTGLFGGIIMLNFSYATVKKREKEYALLRGIGATKRQLYAMPLIETSILFILSLIISLPLSYVGSILFLLATPKLPIEIKISPTTIFITLLIAYLIMLAANFIPVSKAIKDALTGTFDSQEERLIQVRNTKRKPLTQRRLALRNLSTHSINTALMGILLLALLMINANAIVQVNKQKELIEHLDLILKNPIMMLQKKNNEPFTEEEIEDSHKQGIHTYLIDMYDPVYINQPTLLYSNNRTLSLPPLTNDSHQPKFLYIPITKECKDVIEKYQYDGSLPQSNDEVLLSNRIGGNSFEYANQDYSKQPILNISFSDKSYQVCGITSGMLLPDKTSSSYLHSETMYFPIDDYCSAALYLLPEALPETAVYFSQILLCEYDDEIQKTWLNAYFENVDRSNSFSSIVYNRNDIDQCHHQISSVIMYNSIISVILLGMCLMIHIQKILSAKEQMTQYQLIGMTRQEMFLFYFWQNITMSGVVVLISALLCKAAFEYFSSLSITTFLLLNLGLISFFTILFMIPVCILLRNNQKDAIDIKEDY